VCQNPAEEGGCPRARRVQFPDSTQGFNRYTYVGNNPLSNTDPSGYFTDAIFGVMVGVLSAWNPAVGAAFAAAFGYMTTGDIGVAMYAGMSAYVGGMLGVHGANPMVAGLAQGAISHAGGGRFRDGFIGGVSGSAVAAVGNANGFGNASGMMTSAAIGGTVSQLSGGRFANGAISAAFSFAMARAGQGGGSTEAWDAHAQASGAINAGRIGGATDMATSAINAGRINAATELVAGSFWVRPTSGGVRGCCAGGGGGFYASRSRGGQHNATDYIAYPGESVRAVTAGTVIRTGVASYNQETGSSL
jgi:hypothetical protein